MIIARIILSIVCICLVIYNAYRFNKTKQMDVVWLWWLTAISIMYFFDNIINLSEQLKP